MLPTSFSNIRVLGNTLLDRKLALYGKYGNPEPRASLLKVPESYEKCLRVSSSVKGKPLPTPPRGREWATSKTADIGGDRMNPGIRILPLPSGNGLFGGWISG